VLDEKCIVGGACKHAVPVKHTFATSSRHEHFALYGAMLAMCLFGSATQAPLAPTLQDFQLDINCQFSKWFIKHLPQLAAPLCFTIGWLHSKAGHNLECQLEFSAMFAEGLGRADGEQMERVWVSDMPAEIDQLTSALTMCPCLPSFLADPNGLPICILPVASCLLACRQV